VTLPHQEGAGRPEVRLSQAIRHETPESFVPDGWWKRDSKNALERGFDEQKGPELLNVIK
jgi:hypothetical protein